MTKYVLVLDSETANDISQPICYDIGWAVLDTHTGELIEKYSFAVAEIFLDKELMASAYFAEKIPTYWEEIRKGERQLKSIFNIRKTLHACMKTYGIKRVFAYNMGFDRRSTNNSIRYITGSFYRWFFPYNTELLDIWHATCVSLLNTKKFCNWATENGFVSEKGNIQTSAEVAYRYLTNQIDFIEKHQGINDVEIEAALLMNCVKRKVKMEYYQINTACWRKVQKNKAA